MRFRVGKLLNSPRRKGMSSWPLAGQKVLTKGYCGIQIRKGDLPAPVDIWIYSPLHVDAVTYDEQKDNFGRLLRFKTVLKEWCGSGRC